MVNIDVLGSWIFGDAKCNNYYLANRERSLNAVQLPYRRRRTVAP